ncbi:hypothetical protein BSZ21_10825, partial [Bradyrhizobium canariense]
IMRRRNGLVASSVMGMLLSWVKVANPSSQDRTPRCAILSAALAGRRAYRASGLVHWPVADLSPERGDVRFVQVTRPRLCWLKRAAFDPWQT